MTTATTRFELGYHQCMTTCLIQGTGTLKLQSVTFLPKTLRASGSNVSKKPGVAPVPEKALLLPPEVKESPSRKQGAIRCINTLKLPH